MHVLLRYPRGRRQWIWSAISLLMAAAGVELLAVLLTPIGGSPDQRLLLLVPVAAYAAWRCFMQEDRRARRWAVVFWVLFIFAQILGRRYIEDIGGSYQNGTSAGGLEAWLMMAGCSLCLCWAPAWITAKFFGFLQRRSMAEQPAVTLSPPEQLLRDRRWFKIYLLIILACWIPVHLAYFPGMVEYDSGYQLFQSWNHTYNSSNPLFHTFILGWFYLTFEQFGATTAGIAAFCFCQMLLVGSALAYALLMLRRNGCPRLLRIILLVLFAVLPVFPMLAISCTKDVPFYALMLIQICLSYEMCRNEEAAKKKRNWVYLCLLTLLYSLFRANAIGGFVLIAVITNLMIRNSRTRLRILSAMVTGALIAIVVNQGMVAATNAEKTLKRESLGIPIVQLARTQFYHDEVREDIREAPYIEDTIVYIPQLVDLAKWCFDITDENQADFFRLWAKWFARYPVDYVDAALFLNKGYWSLSDTNYAYVYGHGEGTRAGVIPSNVAHGISTIVEHSFFPELEELYEQQFSTNLYLENPVLRVLMSPAVYFWLMVFCLCGGLALKRWDLSTGAWQGVILTLALLAGPCCIVRYAFLLYMLAPITLGMLLSRVTPPAADRSRAVLELFAALRRMPAELSGRVRKLLIQKRL